MTEHHEGHGAHEDHDAHEHIDYRKIYFILLFLLVVSILGPEIGVKWVTLITAFGIALVKAWLVIQNFMHLRVEKMIVKWFLATSAVLMALYFFGVAPDVMEHEGQNWVNQAALAATERGIPVEGEHEGEEDHAEEDAATAGEEHAGEESHDDDPLAAYPEIEVSTAMAPGAGDFDAASIYRSLCASCHGAEGAGDGVASAALDPAPANFGNPDFWEQAPDERRINAILNGGVSVGLSPAMPAWSSQLDEEQAARMVEYLKTFQNE